MAAVNLNTVRKIIETRLEDVDRGVSPILSFLAALMWSIIPWYWFNSRMENIQP